MKGLIRLLFLCYPKCTTCQKAKQFLDTHALPYSLRNIKEENPTYDEIKAWQQKSGLPLKRFFNTSGLQYRALELKDRLTQMSEEEQLRLLTTDGMLVKRPLLILEDDVLVGFREAQWKEKLL